MEVYRRSSWLLLIFGITLLATALQGVQGEAESEGPSESECQQFIEKALKKLEIGEAAIHTTDTSDIPDIPETKQTTESKENSKEDVPTVEITTDDSDHNDGEDDMHEDKEEKVEEATESSELENILNKNQESKETKDEKSTEKTEEEKSAEETEVIDTETHKSNENEQESDTSQQKSQEEETKDDEKDENLEEKEEEEEEKEEAEAEDIDEPSGEVTDKSDEHPSKEDLKEESVETVTETKSAEVTKKEKIIAEEPSKPLESEPTQKKNKWWNLEELEEAKRELEEKQKQEAEAIPKRKKNKWWNIEESEETETIEEEPKPVEEPVKGKNKWWNLDEMEEAIIEKKEEPKIEQSKTEEPTQKKNKWWNLEELAEAQAEAKAKEEEVAKVEMTVKKKNKWWRTESDEDTHEETVKETIEESKIQKREAEPPQPPRKKNKWWKLESGEVEEPEPIEKKEEDIKIETEAPRKKNKWWNVDEIEKEEEKHEEKVVEKIEPEQPRKKNKWWKYDDESSEVEIQKLIKEKPVEKPSTPPSTPPHPKNKWWKSDSGEVDEIKIEKVEKVKTVTTEEPKRPKNKWWKSESEEAEMKDEQEKQKLWKVEKTEQVIKDQERIFMTLGQSKESDEEIEHESREESEPAPEEDLGLDIEIPSELRPRDHVEKLLKLDDKSSDAEAIVNRIAETTLKELKRLYEQAIKPLEVLYKYRDLSNRHFGDSEIFSKPLILFMGPWSGGKSSIINYLLNNEYNETSLRTGAEPSPAYFNILMYGNEPEILDGTQLVADFTFSGLQKFGQGLEERLRGLKLPSKLLEKVNIVEIPGILEVRKQVSRMFPFNDACQWFIDRADIIFLVYDPSKLDVGPETEAILDQLKGREHQTRIILNKADQIKPEELLRVQGALIWNISPLMSSAQPPIMYTTSLWSKPYESWAPVRLLQAQERSFLRDLRSAIDKRIDNKIASARRFAVRVRNHAKMVDCYLTTYYNHKSVFGNRKIVSDEIIEHPQNYHIYEGLSTLTNISRYDLPDPDVYRDFFKLNPLYDFQQLSSTCTYFRGCPINRLDVSIAYDLPELVGKHKRIIENSLNENSNDNKLNDNNPTTVPTS